MVHQSEGSAASGIAGNFDAVQEHLQKTKLKILTEIQHYPTPIPHCDQQFNWLLEQRDSVSEELHALEELRERAEAALAEFVQTSRFIRP